MKNAKNKPTIVEQPVNTDDVPKELSQILDEGLHQVMISKICRSVDVLVDAHWDKIREFESEEGKSGFSVSVEIQRGCPSRFKTRISFAQKVKAEIEGEIDDPRQGKLSI